MFSVIFPGQGSQIVGMGKDFFQKYDLVKSLFKKADEVLGISLSKIILDGSKEELDLTVNTQPAIFLISHSIFEVAPKEFNLNLRCPETLNNEIELQHLKKIKPNVVVVVAYGKILPDKFLNIKGITFINIHASLLPRWRGAAPIQRAIMNMDKETGISIMKISSKLDTGPVMMKSKISIDKTTTFINLSNIMSKLSSSMIIEAFTLLKDGTAKFIPQNEEEATYANKIEKTEGKINWNIKAEEILGLINGLFPSPGAWFTFKGERYKILKAEVGNSKGEPGIVLGHNLEIGCKEGSLKITEIQREGKKVQKIGEFLLGSRIKKGSNLNNV